LIEIIPPVFEAIGTGLVVIFFATVWYWMKYNEIVEHEMKKAAGLNIAGFAFLLMAVWFVCGMVAFPGYALVPAKANYELSNAIAYVVMILLLFGFVLVFLGQRSLYIQKQKVAK
jgi:magnesium-transporting ATPase (P-type)